MQLFDLNERSVSLVSQTDDGDVFDAFVNSPSGRVHLQALQERGDITQAQYDEIHGVWGDEPAVSDADPRFAPDSF